MKSNREAGLIDNASFTSQDFYVQQIFVANPDFHCCSSWRFGTIARNDNKIKLNEELVHNIK